MRIFGDFAAEFSFLTRDLPQEKKNEVTKQLSEKAHIKHLSALVQHHFDCTDEKISSSDEQKKRCGETFARLIRSMPRRFGHSTVVHQNFERLPDRELANFKETMRSNRVIFKNAALKYCMGGHRANDIESMSQCFEAIQIFDKLHDLVWSSDE